MDFGLFSFKKEPPGPRKILVVIDGLGDLPTPSLSNKTPLEYASTPNLDELTKKGKLGYMFTVGENVVPQSDSAVVAILGNNPIISTRGTFEAAGIGVNLERGDLAVRTNFCTVDNLKSKILIDRRAGRTLTTNEAAQLAKAINKQVKLPVKFEFIPTLQHRGVLILRGGFSDNITDTDTHYFHLDKKHKLQSKETFSWAQPLDDEENTEFTVNLINSFIDQSFKVLNNHPINQIREKRGLMQANLILTRGAGIALPKLKKFHKAMAIVNMPLEKGICKTAGMDVYSFGYPQMKGYDVYENLYVGLLKSIKFAIKVLKRKGSRYDFCYIHFKETDVPGHDGKPFEKKNFIEIIDSKFFGFLKNYVENNKLKLIVTGDHSTPCKLKDHSKDPVPVLLYDPEQKPDKTTEFSEREAKRGALGKILGKNLLKKTGFI